MERQPHPSDLTDDPWALVEELIPPAKPGGCPRKHDLRELLNAPFDLHREGCSWRALPHDLGIPWRTVSNYFRAWRANGTWDWMVDTLRRRLRQAAGCDPEPKAAYSDSQSVKTAQGGEPRGYDRGTKVQGRQRPILVDSLGLLLAVVVTAAHVDDARAAQDVCAEIPGGSSPRLEVVWADSKYHHYELSDWLAAERRASRIGVVRRPEDAPGWVPLPKRWVVERTFAWLGRYRRRSKDYEKRTETSATVVQVSAIHHMLRRLKPKPKQKRFHYKRPRKKPA